MSNPFSVIASLPQLRLDDEELVMVAKDNLPKLTEEVIRRTLANSNTFRNQLTDLRMKKLMVKQLADERVNEIERAATKKLKQEENDAVKMAQAMLNSLKSPTIPQPKLVPPPPAQFDPAKIKEKIRVPVNYPSQMLTNINWALAMQWLLTDNLKAVKNALQHDGDNQTLKNLKSDILQNQRIVMWVIRRSGSDLERTTHQVKKEVQEWMMKDPVLAALITLPSKSESTRTMSEAEQKNSEQKTAERAKKVERLTKALMSVDFTDSDAQQIAKNCLKKHDGDLLRTALGKRENSDLIRMAGVKLNDAVLIAKADEDLKLAYRYAQAIGITREEFDAKHTARCQVRLVEQLTAQNKSAEMAKVHVKQSRKAEANKKRRR